jgi:hypothetical protein
MSASEVETLVGQIYATPKQALDKAHVILGGG